MSDEEAANAGHGKPEQKHAEAAGGSTDIAD
jgi:hypothetical protein